MLEQPIRATHPTDEYRLVHVRDMLEGCDYASIDGPTERSLLLLHERTPSITVVKSDQEVQARVIFREFQVYPAAKGIQCDVCNSLVEEVFSTVQFVANHDKVLTEDVLTKLLKRACDEKILHSVLGKYAVVWMPNESRDGAFSSPSSYALQLRPKSLPFNSKEISAVSMACSAVLLEINEHISERMAVSLKSLQHLKLEFLAKQGQQGKGMEAMCEDENAQCPLWALRGECTKNPVYMLYHCKASCGVCSGPRTSKFKELQSEATEKLKKDTCGVLASCVEASMDKMIPVEQTEEENEQLGEEGVAESVREAADQSTGDVEAPPIKAGAEKASGIEAYLEQDLGDLNSKCIYLNQGWWTYQICYKLQIRQLHFKEKKVELQHELGTFDEALTDASAQQEPFFLSEADFLPDMKTHLRYARHIFSNGSPCGEEDSEVRHTELRIACSPDMGIHMKIREPEVCSYIIVLYLPALCEHPDYSPARG